MRDVTREDVSSPSSRISSSAALSATTVEVAGRERRAALLLRGPRPRPVPVEPRQRRLRPTSPTRAREIDAKARPGRRHQGLLRTGHDDVDPPRVRLERHGAEARDRVDDRDRARLVARGDESLDVRDDAGRGLRVDDEGDLRPALGERARDILGARRQAPVVRQRHDLAAERGAELLPARAELAVRDDEHLLARREEVGERRFERARAGGGEEEHVVLGPEDLLQPREHLEEDRLEVGRAVVDDRLGERRQHLRRHGRRPRREEIALLRHRREPSEGQCGVSQRPTGKHRCETPHYSNQHGVGVPQRCFPGRTFRDTPLASPGRYPGLPPEQYALRRWKPSSPSRRRSSRSGSAPTSCAGTGSGPRRASSPGLRRSPPSLPARGRSRGARRPAGATLPFASTTSSAACSPRRCSAPARCCGSASAGSAPLTLVYVGLAVGIAIAVPLTAPVSGNSIPEAQAHLDLFPARILAIAANSLGTLAAVTVAAIGLRRRPLGNALILAGRDGRGRGQRARRSRRGGVVAVLGRRCRPPLRRLRRSSSPRIGASAGRSPRARRRRSLSQTAPSSAADGEPDRELRDQARRAAVREHRHPRESSQRPPTV